MKLIDCLIASVLVAGNAMLITGCTEPKPAQSPQQAVVQQHTAQDKVNKMSRFLVLCNNEHNGGIVKFEHEHVEYNGRTTRLVPTRIECKNGLSASYESTE